MTVSAISGYGRIQNIYMYHNTHYNQVQAAPVTPVKRAGGVLAVSDEEDRLYLTASRQPEKDSAGRVESAIVAKQTEKIKNSFDAAQEMQYELSNPYEMSRMSLDGMLVTGMNIDVMA